MNPGSDNRAFSLVSRRVFLSTATLGAGALLTGTWATGWLDRLGPGQRVYPHYAAETSVGWRKYSGNPVVGGKLGSCFDVCVLRDGGKYRMWLSWRPHGSVALVQSLDGIHWSEPITVLEPNAGTGWQDVVNRPVVLKTTNGYQMWYTGQSGSGSWIGHAASRDGVRWTQRSPHPVLSPDQVWEKGAVMCPDVLWDQRERQYMMWYSAGDQYEPDAIGYATSADGRHWTKHASNPIFRSGRPGAWDGDKVTACQVIRRGEWYVLFYIGFFNENAAQIGLARSRDGITAWQRHPANPIIRPALASSGWDYGAVYKPFALPARHGWMLWYNGRRGDFEQIGLALHTGLDLDF